MKNIKIKSKEEYETLSNKKNQKKICILFNYLIKKFPLIIIFINTFLLLFIMIEINDNKKIIKELIILKDYLTKNKNYKILKHQIDEQIEELKNEKLNKNEKLDIDMIGLVYPEINFDKIKYDLMNYKYVSSMIEFLKQLEIKLIFLEREINATKINAFYTARTQLLKERDIEYHDSNITELHNIVSWLIIHRSTQLKGIVTDKYLACKYAKMKLGIDLCP